MPKVTVTREKLYEEVWSQPIMRLSQSYGLSDVGFAKLCKRHNIPRPPRGYWARLQAGQTVEREPLPAQDGPAEFQIFIPEGHTEEDSDLAPEVQELKRNEEQAETPIVVSTHLRGAHDLVRSAREELEQAKAEDSGILRINGTRTLAISVTRAQVHRALLICDALLKALESRKYGVAAGPKITIFKQTISFEIKEWLRTEKQTPKEHDLSGEYEFGHSRVVKRTVPSGELVLFIPEADRYWARGCRKQWGDGKKQRLEDVLDRVVAGLVDVAAHERQHEIDQEQERLAEIEAEKKRQETAKRRADLIAKQKAERSKLDELLAQAKGLKQCRAIRELVDEVRKAKILDDGKFDKWAAWALMHADRLDPTKDSPKCILDEPVPEEPRRW